MTPELEHSFSLTIQVDKPVIVSRSPQSGKRQLIPILSGTVRGELNGHVLPGGVDSQIVEPDGTCRLSARYALHVEEGTVYIENNGIRRLPEEYIERLFGDDMRFFSDIPPEAIYFRTVPTFEVDAPALRWLTTSLFICSGGRTQDGVMLDFYRVR
ncbi:DUF3237 domain-containing protein [Klebsiella michiganensis]|uniref:DUF3237 domain-containing protein n=1 Tax=Klebsiella michiganensis TaxID=1134687 RepID=UPI001CCA39E9|nr:DUF3237 domain-containing protein [Klebsiella michiganensis]MBZ7497446.1 DUF3237 domain-containing protein [Klebsiella michiganensis]